MTAVVPRAASSGRFCLALAVATGATLALEIVQTRLLSVVSWYHLAFFVISLAMFGMTLGALYVFLRPDRFDTARLDEHLSRGAYFAAIATAVAWLDQLCLAPEMVLSASAVVVFARLAITVSVPFFFSGIVVTLALTRSPYPIGRTYGADLAGAALGCVAVIPLLGILDGPSAIFVAASLFAVSSAMFAPTGKRRRGMALALFLAALAVVNSQTRFGLDPIMVKGQAEKRHWVAYERWNSFSRIIAYKPWNESPKMVMWAASDRTPTTPVEFVMMNIDGLAGTAIFKMAGDPRNVDFLRYDVTTLAHHVRQGRAAIIGVGGGRDVMAALALGQREVLGVELNPAFTEALTGPYREFAGLADHAGVRLVTDEARSFFTRDAGKYDVLQASLIDTWAATGAGAYSLSENSIYTVEAWRVFLDRLAPGGIFTVSRWYAPDRLDETARLVSLAAGTLLARGVADPSKSILLAAHGQVATIAVANEPFAPQDIARFTAVCNDMGFEIVLAPGMETRNATLAAILSKRTYDDLVAYGRSTPLDLTPPTDARPFFFNLLRLSRPWEIVSYLGRPSGVVAGNLIATLTLIVILFVTALLAAATIILPARFAPAGSPRPGARPLAYFALIGLAFMLSEIAFLQQLSVYLGHPVYSLAVVLFSIILFTGLGSFASDRLALDTPARIRAFAFVVASYLVAMAFALPRLTAHFGALELAGRIALCVAVLAPAGMMMGQAFPAGMRWARRGLASGNDPTPWLWAVNGAAGVVASAAAVMISIAFGITTTMIAGAACYAAVALVVSRRD